MSPEEAGNRSAGSKRRTGCRYGLLVRLLRGVVTEDHLMSALPGLSGDEKRRAAGGPENRSAKEPGRIRLDLVMGRDRHDLSEVARAVSAAGATVLEIGLRPFQWSEGLVFSVLLCAADGVAVADALTERGYRVLRVRREAAARTVRS